MNNQFNNPNDKKSGIQGSPNTVKPGMDGTKHAGGKQGIGGGNIPNKGDKGTQQPRQGNNQVGQGNQQGGRQDQTGRDSGSKR